MIGFLAASIFSLEIVAQCWFTFFGFDADSQGRWMSAIKSSSGSWERPQALPKLVAKIGTGERLRAWHIH